MLHVDDEFHKLRTILEFQKRKRQNECEHLAQEVRQVPVSDELLGRLCEQGPEFSNVITAHPGYRLDRKLDSLRAVLEAFRTANTDLEVHLSRFEAHNRQSWGGRKGKQFETIIAAVAKEIFAISSAAYSLEGLRKGVLTCFARGISQPISSNQFELRFSAMVDPHQHEFVIYLRKVLTHEMFLKPDWKISYRFGSEEKPKLSALEFRAATMPAGRDFSQNARAYVDRCKGIVDVQALFAGYSAAVVDFYSWFYECIEAQLPVEILDYRRCLKAQRSYTSRMTWRLILNHAISSNSDPYEYLERHLEPEELDEIKRLPDRSAAQINRIIELVDTNHACNEELRALVFRLFKIEDDGYSVAG